MGDSGDYWREHRDWEDRKKYGDIKPDKPNKHKPWKCSCGYAGVDKNAINQHRLRWGKKEHKIVAEPPPEDEHMTEADYQTWDRL